MRAVLRGLQDADVPCDGCVGCCVSSYPIPLRATDQVALERVPAEHLKLALGEGRAVMGYRGDGTCPMLEARCCTIYSDRPQTCRDYDCRIYAAAGFVPDGDRPVIQERVLEWEFRFEDTQVGVMAKAMRDAATFIRRHADQFPMAMRAGSATAAAVLAVKTCELFLPPGPGEGAGSDVLVQRIIAAARAFDHIPGG